MVQAIQSTVNTRTDFFRQLKEKKMIKSSSTINNLEELKKTF